MPLSTILVLLLILISLFPTTSPTSPAPASCTSVTSAAFDPCLTLKLPPPSPPPSSILNKITATPSFSISTGPKFSVCSSSKTHLHGLLLEQFQNELTLFYYVPSFRLIICNRITCVLNFHQVMSYKLLGIWMSGGSLKNTGHWQC